MIFLIASINVSNNIHLSFPYHIFVQYNLTYIYTSTLSELQQELIQIEKNNIKDLGNQIELNY